MGGTLTLTGNTNTIQQVPSGGTTATVSDLVTQPGPSTPYVVNWVNIQGKPAFGTASLRDVPAAGDASTLQAVLGSDSRLTNSRSTTSTQITDSTATGRALITAVSATQARATLGSTSVGDAVFTAATSLDGRNALGLGTISIQNANAVAITGGSVAGVTLSSSNVTITGGSITGITDLAVADGGTGASAFAGAFGGTQFGWRNLLINALGTINVRGYVSGAATGGANQYTLDRWRVVTSGQSLSWTSSGIVNTMTAPAGGVEQVVEGANIIGGTYTLSWTGTATATINGSGVSNGGQVSLTANTNATVRFSGGTFSLPSLELGSNAGTFEVRPALVEQLLCQRYCPSFSSSPSASDDVGTCVFGTTNTGVAMVLFKTPPRAAPTGLVFASGSASNMSATTALAAAALTGLTFTSAGSNSARLNVTQAGTTWTVNAAGWLLFSTAASFYLTGSEL